MLWCHHATQQPHSHIKHKLICITNAAGQLHVMPARSGVWGPGSYVCMQACEKALTKIQPHQRVNCVPGIASLARKNRLIASLVQHYGEGAFELTPRSWLLPEQYWHWRLRAEAQATHLTCPPRAALSATVSCIPAPHSPWTRATCPHATCPPLLAPCLVPCCLFLLGSSGFLLYFDAQYLPDVSV